VTTQPCATRALPLATNFELLGDLGAPVAALLAGLRPDVRMTEYPNVMNTCGAVRDRDPAVAAFWPDTLWRSVRGEILRLWAIGPHTCTCTNG